MRILIADDHPLYREALRTRLERMPAQPDVLEATSTDEVLALAGAEALDLIILDFFMPGLGSEAGVRQVVEAFAGTAVVLMSGAAPNEEVRKAVDAGVRGFIPKTVSSDVMQAAIGIVIAGGTYVPAEVFQGQLAPVAANGEAPPPEADKLALYRLTPREHQVLLQLASGASNKEIGRGLGLSEVTVKLHVRQILRKISARNRAEAAVIVTRAGLI